jgi:hypothetical protein
LGDRPSPLDVPASLRRTHGIAYRMAQRASWRRAACRLQLGDGGLEVAGEHVDVVSAQDVVAARGQASRP